MRIYDCFTFFNEIELLKFRLELLYDYVDKFIISEANVTHSGVPKGFNFFENKNQFEKWIDKIEYIRYKPDLEGVSFFKPNRYDVNNPAWMIERGQRDLIKSRLIDLPDDCLAIVGDLDEIWNPEIFNNIDSNFFSHKVIRLEMLFSYFYFNCVGIGAANSKWHHAYAIFPSILRSNQNIELSQIRTSAKLPVISNGGWHFSYLGGANAVINKIKSFAHQELNNAETIDHARIVRCITQGFDPFDRKDHKWSFVDVFEFPEIIQHHMRNYPNFIAPVPK